MSSTFRSRHKSSNIWRACKKLLGWAADFEGNRHSNTIGPAPKGLVARDFLPVADFARAYRLSGLSLAPQIISHALHSFRFLSSAGRSKLAHQFMNYQRLIIWRQNAEKSWATDSRNLLNCSISLLGVNHMRTSTLLSLGGIPLIHWLK
jgi:hypothetical protein